MSLRQFRPAAGLICIIAVMAASCSSRKAAGAPESSSEPEIAVSDSMSSPDLTLHLLRGPVVRCETIEIPASLLSDGSLSAPDGAEGTYIDSLVFSPQGLLLSQNSYRIYEGDLQPAAALSFTYTSDGDFLRGTDTSVMPPLQVDLQRNAYGEITLISVGSSSDDADTSYSYSETFTWGSGRLESRELKADEVQSRTRYSYGSGSDPVSATVRSDDIEQSSVSIETYTYTSRDDRGNWTERRVEISTETRAYDVEVEPYADSPSEAITYRIDRRRITYR